MMGRFQWEEHIKTKIHCHRKSRRRSRKGALEMPILLCFQNRILTKQQQKAHYWGVACLLGLMAGGRGWREGSVAKCLPCKQEELNATSRTHMKMPGVVARTCYLCAGRAEVWGSPGWLANHSSPTGKGQTNKILSLVPCIGDRH